MKRWITGLVWCLCVCLLAVGLSGRAAAADVVASGDCGDKVEWVLDSEGTLTISGSGAMRNYAYSTQVPWYSQQSAIKNVVIESGVTSIGNSAFWDCHRLIGVTISDSVTSIGDHAFDGCYDLISVTIPDSVTSIGDSAFSGCYDLTSVTIPNSVTSIGTSAFGYCSSLTSITIPDSVTSISSEAFIGCSDLTSVTIPNSVTSIGDYAFYHCKVLANITLPNSVTSIGDGAFSGCSSLTSIKIPNSVTSIGTSAFSGCRSLASVTIPESVTSIRSFAFENCISLTDITIPNSMTSIASYMFKGCSSLTNITIPNSVTYIYWSAFEGCSNLKDVYYIGSKAQWKKISIYDDNVPLTNATIHYCSHTYESVVTPPSCTANGYTTHTCTICGDSYTDASTDALGHDYKAAITEPTCTTQGYTTYTCSRCNDSYTDTTYALGHDYAAVVTAPTCTEDGYTTYTCSRCGNSYQNDYTPALGHTWDNGVVTVQPTRTTPGEMTYTCTRCGETRTDTIPAAGGYTPCDGSNCPGMVFTDMPAKGNWAHDPIDWALERKITAGTSATTFSPKSGCTRAQVVSFLWRAAGQPEPVSGSNPFVDVQPNAYYYKAVLWAVENKITAGTSATTFSPNDTCTRAQIVAFLWRYEGEPTPETATNPFADVPSGAYYAKAVLWASENGVTAGTSATTFSPSDTCTRAQVVAFLYRDLEK